MVNWKEEISEMNLLTSAKLINLLKLEDNEKCNLIIINATIEWIIDNIKDCGWKELYRKIENSRIGLGEMERGILTALKKRKDEEYLETFARTIIAEYKGIDATVRDATLLKTIPSQVFSSDVKMQGKLINARDIDDFIHRIRDMCIFNKQPNKLWCTRCKRVGHKV